MLQAKLKTNNQRGRDNKWISRKIKKKLYRIHRD